MDTKTLEALLAARDALAPLSARCDEAVRPDDTDRDGVTVKTGHLRGAKAALLLVERAIADGGHGA